MATARRRLSKACRIRTELLVGSFCKDRMPRQPAQDVRLKFFPRI
jgi:hypothetical protein